MVALQIDDANGLTTLAGITMPLGTLSVPESTFGPMLAVVSAGSGLLGADTAPGAVVRGGGTNTLWITGTAAQVNAKLATLTYRGAAPGDDALTVTVIDGGGTLSTPIQLPVAVVSLQIPATAPTIAITRGTLTLDTRLLDGPRLSLTEAAGSRIATTAILVNTTLSARSALLVHNNNPANATAPRLAVAGRVELDGASSFTGNGTAVTVAQNAILLNRGTMQVAPGAATFTGAGTLLNDGTLTVAGDGTATGHVRIATALGGSGQVVLGAGASVSLGTVAATEVVQFGDGAQTLHLLAPAAFGGVLTGFSDHDAVALDGAAVTSAFYSTSAGTGGHDGTLSLFNGTTRVADLRFSGTQPGTTFQLAPDGAGGSIIRLAPLPADAAAPVPVFRFFDALHGTQLLTDNRAERDAILATRPDLRDEGVAFGAAPADANAVAVYRFFDTGNGTHLLTASSAERDQLLGTRPDLVFEPNSTMFEHAAPQAGDMAVFRFFDRSSGAHFYTGNGTERATILATRPDLTPEGIAFYAPGM